MTSLPLLFARPNWYTSSFVAARLGVPLRTIQYWCRVGFFARRGCTVVGTTGGEHILKGSRYWIYMPLVSKDAILRKVPLDIPSLSPVA